MNAQNNFTVWLSEPVVLDDSPSNSNEHPLDWLYRCTNAKAKECRRFLNECLGKFPTNIQDKFKHNLKVRWAPTYFELIVARFLQELGAEIEFEIENKEGRNPDFLAKFDYGDIVVEAKAPTFNKSAFDSQVHQIPLLELIEANIPDGLAAVVWEVPNILPSDSKKEFKKVIEQIFCSLSSMSLPIELTKATSQGLIRIQFFCYPTVGRKILAEPPLSLWDDSEKRIKSVIKKKRSQVRSSNVPVLLALCASFLNDKEDFDIALLGHSYERLGIHGEVIETGFSPNGIFSPIGNNPPTFSGALVFLNFASFVPCSMPILYRHPRFSGKLPRVFEMLELRTYDQEQKILKVEEAKLNDIIEKIGFVNPSPLP